MAMRKGGFPAGVGSPPKAAAGWRLVFVPSRIRELAVLIGGGVMAPPMIASPLLLAALVAALFSGSPFFWGVLWILLGLTGVAVIVLVVGGMCAAASTMVRWVEFRPEGLPDQVVIARFARSSTMAMAELQRVVVFERLRLGRRKSIKVLLHTRGGTVECKPATLSPLARVDTQRLIDRLTEQLGPAGVVVEGRTESERNFLCPDEWWTPSRIADLWQVPSSAVDGIAAQHGVRGYAYTPRAGAMCSPDRAVTVYDPGRAYEVAEDVRAEQAAGQAFGSGAAPGPAEDGTPD
ncbi:hypothetical protein ABT010_15775 [Streptomyces sp. NPDC002668]|uniref:hypothetical protein n=1 Tax=Streptomyces sp. NPDC002668 TaxID=3154422 RepID=UPI003334A40E